jgi:hypothetical protein
MPLRRTLFFLIYFMAALALFAVLRFPHQAAALKISRMGESLFPGLEITLDRVSPAPPLGVKTEKPQIRVHGGVTVVPEDLRIRIPVPAVLGLEKTCR